MIPYASYFITFLSIIGFIFTSFTPNGPPDLLVRILNAAALSGWITVIVLLVDKQFETACDLALSLEYIAFVEVLRILRKQLAGNFVLGIILHCIRTGMILSGFPRLLALSVTKDNESDTFWVEAILWTWAITEVSRYPMYLMQSKIVRLVRMVVPVFTFPLGAGSEAYVSYLLLKTSLGLGSEGDASAAEWMARLIFGLTLFINALLGPTMAYPAIVKKAMKELSGKEEKNQKSKDASKERAETSSSAAKKRKKARKDD
uniref:Very-long-chain (3R)-3-hydroxyacyl-CoA dehydratase n=1 Tax=Helicotheca tamesis TaxID=374047 RepID=A0A7S2N1V3_9STRA|mmetsp:Transcript_7833/g.10718  ORF Transcript_7833/g.10718 Transcript_7833/m.10718 type:complete len:260 (+) Transcript_7833:144-923(+)|eukprot:CAMPEP_0185729930 /NCGR_PEP_ID=MMETSP1171-20130828/7762_1 /TAXON_ID=374046 /ORGANISM="Helicotheca tamensis, Strain CCMP826" /LENGTH=259 /DNA_ID=CAMNT_0028398873 /DNA_START=101 /DNA_END=880 /DNA_ORIENTATION=-